jgi:predicted phosphodiesterase
MGYIVAFGDLHLRSKYPEMRIDDYEQEQYRKLKYSFEQIPRNSLVAFPGDVFDSAREPYWLIEMLMTFCNKRKDAHFLFIAGQHDMRYHKLDLYNTPIRLLQAGIQNSTLLGVRGCPIRGFLIYGRAFGADIPKPCEKTKERQILLAHKMMVKEEDLYPGQNAILSQNFMRLYPYNLIISGDNHQRFMEQRNGRLLVNMGSFMRMKTDQKKHIPAICIIDEDNLKPNVIEIPIQSADTVFAKKDIKAKQMTRTIGEDFIRGIKEDERKSLTFLDRLNRKLRKESPDVKEVINQCLQQIGE